MDIDELAETPTSTTPLGGPSRPLPAPEPASLHRFHGSLPQDLHRDQGLGADGAEPDPQGRSHSMDSAYGTLSPESLLKELGARPGHSEGEDTEEDEGGERRDVPQGEHRGMQEEEGEQFKTEVEEEPLHEEEEEEEEGDQDEEEEEEEEDSTSLGSQLSVVQASKPRRRPHVLPRLRCLQRPATLTVSRSEDNLLQHFHGGGEEEPAECTVSSQSERSKSDGDGPSMVHSRSLTELGHHNGIELLLRAEPVLSKDTCPPAEKLGATLRRAEARRGAAAAAAQAAAQADRTDACTDGDAAAETQAPASPEGRRGPAPAVVVDGAGEALARNRKSPGPQHKKLTVAQLYRIRTTLVLNSTLTAS